MPDPEIPPSLASRPVVTASGATIEMSPSPEPGERQPQRRQADTASYGLEWTILLGGIATFGATFFADMADVKTWSEMATPHFVGIHFAQFMGVISAIVAAKRIK